MLTIYADGGCRNNGRPNARAYARYRLGDGPVVTLPLPKHFTNNQAEYLAVTEALRAAIGLADEVTVYSDSQLVVNQYKGAWKCNSTMAGYLVNLHYIASNFSHVDLQWVPREEIERALAGR